MSTVKIPSNFAELLKQLGGVSPRRVRLAPPPGRATVKDVIRVLDKTGMICELVDGTLVEKVMGYSKGSLALWIGHLLQRFLDDNDLGNLAGADATLRIMPQLVRIPDLSFVRWEKLPNKQYPTDPVPNLIPDLAIEVLSTSNTKSEMKRKLKDYFFAGVELVWFVDMDKRTVQVFTAPDESSLLKEGEMLDGGDVLPGLRIPVKKIFARVPKGDAASKPRRNGRKKNQ